MRTVYVNGQWLPEDQATVSIFDRGFLMADGIYEVTTVLDGKLVDFPGHAARLARSLSELDMTPPATTEELLALHRQIVTANALVNGRVYLQVTRGNPGDRDFVFPDPATTPPTLVMFTQVTGTPEDSADARRGLRVISVPDIRWQRRDIKTVQLLYPSMGKMMAKAAGADDAWLVEDGLVTEGTSNNAWIVKGGRVITRGKRNPARHHPRQPDALRRRSPDRGRGTRLYPGRSPGGGRGIRHLCLGLRHAGGRDRRHPHRQRQAGPHRRPSARNLHR
jgi:D-alanine transaminase